MADIDEISTVLGKLQSNYSELYRTFYTMFYDPEPKEFVLKWYDEDGVLQEQEIPNRAKDQNYVKNGNVNPEGVVTAPVGTLYQNLRTGALYSKRTGTGNNGWKVILSEGDLENYIMKGNANPQGQVTAKLGVLYVDSSTGVLYVKITPTGSSGWQPIIDVADARFVHFQDLNETIIIDI